LKTSIVTTTINVPVLLEKYAENARFYGHTDVDFIVIGDRKTPAATRDFCSHLSVRHYPCAYLDIEDQRAYLDRFPKLWEHLRFDSIQRRNIGLLRAYEDGADVVITIDDDNWVCNQDFVGLHGVVGTSATLPAVASTSGWFNVCSTLEDANGTPFYHRGYPVGQRWNEADSFISESLITRSVAVNAGFWLDDPDIDALTRMNRQIVVRGMRDGARPRFALHPGTWSPFNSQNTALRREVIPAYFLSPYIGRYDDIWASYIVDRIAEHIGDVVTFGSPLVRQKRNPHNLWKDVDAERSGMLMTDEFCATLRNIPLTAETYCACFQEIADELPARWQPAATWNDEMRFWRERLIDGLTIWADTFSRVGTMAMTTVAV
jgi:hypothetical protein